MLKRWQGAGIGLVVCTIVMAAFASPVGAGTHQAPAGPVVAANNPTADTLSNGFVGLAIDAAVVGDPVLDPAQSNLPSYMAQLGQANFRIGGQTSDLSVAWLPDPSDPLPSWASSAITPGDLTTIAQLALATGWSVDLGVNLLRYDPPTAANEVQTAQSILGTSLHDVEIGNEPEFYPEVISPWSFSEYSTELSAYETSIKAADPDVSFAGPDLYFTNWLNMFRSQGARRVKALSEFTQHFYPLFDCSGAAVTASDLFSQSSITSEDQTISAAEVDARRGGIPLVLDEFNSVSCGSSSPVVYEFASALWAVHALLEAALKGVASVNVQMDPDNCQSYSPLCAPNPDSPGTLQAQPIFYGMQLVRSLEGGTIMKTRNSSRIRLPAGVSDYAVRQADGDVAVVVDNTTSFAVNQLTLKVDPTARVVSMLTLEAPALTSSGGVTLTPSTPSTGATTGLTVPAETAVVFTLAP
jgi:hypothetical protein